MSWLTGEDLQDLIYKYANESTKEAFIGVFAIDMLPRRIMHYPCFMIVNTHTLNLPGQHWKAIFISENRRGEVFDSLALPISTFLLKWLNTFTKSWSQNKLTIQNPMSATCGAYVLYYILCRMKKGNMNQCLKPFTTNLHLNDQLMLQFIHDLKK